MTGEGSAGRSSCSGLGSAAVALALILLLASRPEARAEDFVDYRYEDYAETGGRINVRTQGLTGSQDIGTEMKVGFTLIDDAIAGASPTGERAPASGQVPLAYLADHRKAWEIDLSRQIGRVNVSVGYSQSREHDYVSRGWSLNTLTDFNQKNTGILVGIAGHGDGVETFFDPQHVYYGKQEFSAIVGVHQLVDPLTTVTVNVTWSRETGFLNDQYKLVEKTVELVPGSFFDFAYAENRPDMRDSGVAYASVNRAFPAASGALEASYRFYADTYGIDSNAGELRWIQKLGSHVTLAPELRASVQGAARFYYCDLDETAIMPTVVPNPSGPNYSSDYRLSALDTVSAGLRATWKVADHVQLEAGYVRYAMHGRDDVTPQSAYPVANILSAGARFSW